MSGCGTGTHDHGDSHEHHGHEPVAAPTNGSAVETAGTNGAHAGLLLSPKAVEMVKEAVARDNLEGYGLRVAVVGGGCSGYQYSLDLSKETGPLDTILEQDGVKIFVDMLSMGYLDGTTIDYVETMHGAGFKFENPKAVKTCGCGSSFSP